MAERPPPTEARTSCLRAPHFLCPPGEQWIRGFPIWGAGRGCRGWSALPLNGAGSRGPGTGPRPGRARTGHAWAVRLLPAQPVSSPGRLLCPHPGGRRQGSGHSPAGERGSRAGPGQGEPPQVGWSGSLRLREVLGNPPALLACHATENHEGNKRVHRPVCRSSPPQGCFWAWSLSLHTALSRLVQERAAVLGSPVGTRGGGVGGGPAKRRKRGSFVGAVSPLPGAEDLAAPSGCLALGSGTDSENSFLGLFVFLEKFPSYAKSQLTGNTWWAVTGVEEDWG